MRLIVQRVLNAQVEVDKKCVGKIERGFLVFIGINNQDTKEIADKMIKKLLGLRIFPDENDKINLDLQAVNGQLLLVSQFTLYADCKKGNRPSFIEAGSPETANALYEYMIEECTKQAAVVQHGIFGAEMKVSSINDGPFTVILDSDVIIKPATIR